MKKTCQVSWEASAKGLWLKAASMNSSSNHLKPNISRKAIKYKSWNIEECERLEKEKELKKDQGMVMGDKFTSPGLGLKAAYESRPDYNDTLRRNMNESILDDSMVFEEFEEHEKPKLVFNGKIFNMMTSRHSQQSNTSSNIHH